jgi:hypothetical protein
MENKKRLFNNLKNYFEANLKLSYLSENDVIVITNDDKVYEFSRYTYNIRSLLLLASEMVSSIKSRSLLMEKFIVGVAEY